MSLIGPRDAGRRMDVAKVTSQSLLAQKQNGAAITAITAYDYPTARLVDESGVDVLLIGDSLGMAVLGYEDTLSVTMEDMLHHARAVRRAVQRSMLVVDMPYGSYQVSVEDTLRNALRFVKEAGSEAVKLEGGASQASRVRALTAAEIPVFGHIGLTPQSLYRIAYKDERRLRLYSYARMLWRLRKQALLRLFSKAFLVNSQLKLLHSSPSRPLVSAGDRIAMGRFSYFTMFSRFLSGNRRSLCVHSEMRRS